MIGSVRSRWLALTAWIVVILFNSSVAAAPVPATGVFATLIGKTGHVVEYFLLGWLAWRALVESAGGVGLPPRSAASMILVGGVGVAALDELRQLFVAGRSPSPWDVLIDGLALAAVSGLQLLTVRQAPADLADEARQGVAGEDGH